MFFSPERDGFFAECNVGFGFWVVRTVGRHHSHTYTQREKHLQNNYVQLLLNLTYNLDIAF